MRTARVGAGLLLAALVGCGGPGADEEPATPSATPTAEMVFLDLMDTNHPGWREEFAVDGATAEDAPLLAEAAAQDTCQRLESQSVGDVLNNLLTGSLPPETAGILLYAATVAYCPDHTQDVQDFADATAPDR